MVPLVRFELTVFTTWVTDFKSVAFQPASPQRDFIVSAFDDSGWNCTNSTFASFISVASVMPYLLYLEKQTRLTG